MIQRRVKITGMGPLTPAGTGHEAFLRAMFEDGHERPGRNGLSGAKRRSGLVKDFRIGAYAVDAVHLDSPRHVQFALAASMLALRDAGLGLAAVRTRRPLVVVACPTAELRVIGGVSDGSACRNRAQEAVATWVGGRTMREGVRRCTSGLAAVGLAAEQVACGNSEIAICGGVDMPFHPSILDEMRGLGLASESEEAETIACKPFDLWRKAGSAGEGGCLFVLEPESYVRPGLACVAGFGEVPESNGVPWSTFGDAARLALGNSRLRPRDVDTVQAEGTGQKSLDHREAAALRQFFGSRIDEIPASAVQGAVGNALGGASAIQLGCAALGMKHSLIARTLNWQHPDPACPLKLSQTTRQFESRATLVSARDPHGAAVCLLLTP